MRERADDVASEPLLIVYHPAAGGGGVRSRLERLLRRHPHIAAAARVVAVPLTGDPCSALRATLGDARDAVVVAAGGDGTVNLVATALLGQETASQRKFAVLPLGTGNAFAAGLGIQSVREALAALAAQHTTAIDVMRTTHPDAPVALVSISGGFEARFIREYSARRARWTRIGAGLLSLANAHRRGRTPHILVDGVPLHEDEGRSFNAGLYNMRCYAFGAAIWLDGDHHDGIGEAVVCASSLRYWRMLARGLHTDGRCDVPDPRWQRWRHATITAEDVLQVDGELLAPARFEVRIDPGALRVIVPAGYHGRGPS